MIFRDRGDGGRQLAPRVAALAGEDAIVLGAVRGGVPVAAVVARTLGARLDLSIVSRICSPRSPELTLGALAEDGVALFDELACRLMAVSPDERAAMLQQAEANQRHRESTFRTVQRASLHGRTVVIVDDGIASGLTLRAAAKSARARGAATVIIAAPVASHASIEPLRAVADEVVYVVAPREFGRVGLWYDDFEEITDADALAALQAPPAVAPEAEGLPLIQEVRIPVPRGQIAADLLLPANSELRTQNSELSAVVVFAHGSGSNRHSLRNWHVARALLEAGIGVLLLDLLTPAEQTEDRRTAEHRFDIPLLTARVAAAVDWLGTALATRGLAIGGYGASTGAAAMLAVAAQRPGLRAIVSRGGRVDLAEDALAQVRAPALLVVGSADPQTLAMNQRMLPRFGGPAAVTVVAGADHLFDEPEHLDSLAAAAVSWFGRYLSRP